VTGRFRPAGCAGRAPAGGLARRALLGAAAGLAVAPLAGCAGDPPPRPPPDTLPAPALYTLSPGTPVDGTLRLTIPRAGGMARGTLEANGERYPVTVTGLGFQGGRAARIEATGQVYGLPRTEVVAGRYRNVGTPDTTAGDPPGTLRLGNDELVLIVLTPREAGAALTLAADGMTLALAR
jgi:hypothetical protein